MPVVYHDELYEITQKWIGGWRVRDKMTGATLIPTTDQTVRIGYLWKEIKSGHTASICPPGGIAERVMFQVFARAVAYPRTDEAIHFIGLSVDDTAREIIYLANTLYAHDRLHNFRK